MGREKQKLLKSDPQQSATQYGTHQQAPSMGSEEIKSPAEIFHAFILDLEHANIPEIRKKPHFFTQPTKKLTFLFCCCESATHKKIEYRPHVQKFIEALQNILLYKKYTDDDGKIQFISTYCSVPMQTNLMFRQVYQSIIELSVCKENQKNDCLSQAFCQRLNTLLENMIKKLEDIQQGDNAKTKATLNATIGKLRERQGILLDRHKTFSHEAIN